MIFLSLIAAGAIAGIAVHLWRAGSTSLVDVAQGGATGAFLAGGIAVGIAERPVGPFDPIALAIGLVGAVGSALLVEHLASTRPDGRPAAIRLARARRTRDRTAAGGRL
jgi:hypothetical protein